MINIKLLVEWFQENEVIVNLKKGKTETMIFRTAKHLAILNSGLKVKYQHYTVNVTTSYRYLRVNIYPSLISTTNLWHHIKKPLVVYTCWIGCVSSRIRKWLLPFLTIIFDSKSKADRLSSIDSGATRILNIHAKQAQTVILPHIASNKKNLPACLHVNVLMKNCVITLQNILFCWFFNLLKLKFWKDLFIYHVLSSIMSYLYRFDN